ncbi:MAG: helicase-related protein, partial [Acidobacteriota bacterium]
LLCTEAASEGLNLQTCGVLVNYDMPWNPMRVEQRIGRVDRIGQVHPTVWIRNYFYTDTVEATIYRRLTDRIDWFRAVVGELQPILHRVGEALQSLALVPEARRTKPLEETLARLRRSLDEAPADPMDDDGESDEPDFEAGPLSVPARPADIEALIVGSSRLGHRFAVADEAGAYRLDDGHERLVTFRPEQYADRPYSLDLLSWGSPRFDALLASVEPPPTSDDPAGIGLYQSSNPAPVSLFLAPGRDGVEALTDLSALRRRLALPIQPWRPATEGDASSTFSQRRIRTLRETTRVEAGRRRAERRALLAEAADVVRTAAAVDLLKAEHPGLFDQPLGFGWGREAIEAQRRHGFPFDQIVDRLPDDLGVVRDESTVLALRGRSHPDLDRAFVAAEARGIALVERLESLDLAEALERQALREPSTGGLLDRTFYLVHPEDATGGPRALDPAIIEPFVDAVPMFDDLATAVRDLAEARDEGRDLLAEATREPTRVEWIGHVGRAVADRFAAPLHFDAFGQPAGTVVVFRLETAIPRQGALVIVLHAGQVDLGAWQLDDIWEDGVLEGRRVRLATDDGTIEIEDPEAIRLIASWVETV